MAADSITLLTSINGVLLNILKCVSPQNQTENTKNAITKSNRGGLDMGNNIPKAQNDNVNLKADGISVVGLVKALSSIPGPIKEILKLKGSDLKKFSNVMDIIGDGLKRLSAGMDKEEAEATVNLINATANISKIVKELAKVTPIVPFAILGAKATGKVLSIVIENLKSLSKDLKKGDVEMLKILVDSATKIYQITKDMAKAAFIAPFGILGAAMSAVIIKIMAKMCSSVAQMKDVDKGVENIKKMTSFVDALIKFSVIGLVLTVATLAIGALLFDKWDLLLKGFLMVSAVLLGYTAVAMLAMFAGRFVKSNEEWIYTIIRFAGVGMMLVLATALIGVFADKLIKPVTFGFLMISAVMLGYLGVSILASLIGAELKLTEVAYKSVFWFAAASMALIVASALIGMLCKAYTEEIVIGFVVLMGIMKYIQRVAQQSTKVGTVAAKSLDSMKKVLFLLGGCAVLVVVSAIVGALVKKYYENILIGFASMSIILIAVWGLAVLINHGKKPTITAIRNLAYVEGLLAGTGAIIAEIIGLCLLKDKSGVSWLDMLAMFTAMNAIVIAVGALAFVAGKLKGLKQGAIALALVDAVAAGSALVLAGVVGIVALQKSKGIEWSDVFIALGAMGTIIVGVGALAVAAGALIIPIGLGILAMTPLIAMVGLIELVTLGLIGITVKMKETGNTTENLASTLKNIMGIFTKENLDPPISLKDILKLDVKFIAMLPLIASIAAASVAVGIMTRNLGKMDADGKITPLLSVDEKGNPVYGEPVDIKKVATVLTGAIKIFATEMADTFKDIKAKTLLKLDFAMLTLSLMVEPVAKFTEMLTSFEANNDGTKIRSVKIDANGKLIKGEFVEVASVATNIASAVSAFSKELFINHSEEWDKIVSNDGKFLGIFGKSKNEKAASVFAAIVEPVTKFVEMLGNYGADENGNLTVLNSEGKPETVDLIKISTGISGAVTSFATNLTTSLNGMDVEDLYDKTKVIVDTLNLFGELKLTPANELDSFTKSVGDMITTIGDAATSKRTALLNTFNASITMTTTGMKNFDNTLKNGSKTRKKNLEEFEKMLDKIKTTLDDMGDGLGTLRDTFVAASKMDASKIKDAADAMGSINSTGGSSESSSSETSDGQTKSTDSKMLVDAIREALSGISINTNVMAEGGMPASNMTGDNLTDAIISAIYQSKGDNVNVSSVVSVPAPTQTKK